jgi:hypothetical protein
MYLNELRHGCGLLTRVGVRLGFVVISIHIHVQVYDVYDLCTLW